MDLLKQSRGHLKGTITRAHNLVGDISDDVVVEVLEARLERLEDTWREFCANQNELFKFHAQEGYGDPEVDFEATESKYIATKGALVKAIRKRLPASGATNTTATENLLKQQAVLLETLLNRPVLSPSSRKSVSEVELPAIKIPPFAGDYREWPGFRDMFLGSIDNKSGLSGSQKMRYLKSFLRDDAAKLLNHLDIADSNYEHAWDKLERRYNKPLYIINAYIESFLKMPSVTSADSAPLRKLVDHADEVIRGLSAMKAESRDPWLVYLLLHKTDAETRKSWALESKGSEESTVDDLIEFLQHRCDALEASEAKGRAPRCISRSAPASNNMKSLTASNSCCPKCREGHTLSRCPQFLQMSIPSRRNFVRDQQLCYNCLGAKHSSSRCQVKARCSICRTRHHTLVHPNNINQPVTGAHSDHISNELPNSTCSGAAIVSNHSANSHHTCGLLPTVVVKVYDYKGNPQLCRVLLDTGSQVSFISESLVRRLGLRRRHARLPISGISSLEAGVTHGVVTLSLYSQSDACHIQVEAYILNKITSTTPTLPLQIDMSWLGNSQLADARFNHPNPVDILLGADNAWTVLRDGRRSDPDGRLFAQNTIFGWVVSGKIFDRDIVSLHVGMDKDVDVERLLRAFWEVEEIPQSPTVGNLRSGEDIADMHFTRTFSRTPDSKYIVELPFRQDDVVFDGTLAGALSRLSAMERRFSKNERLRAEYCQFMRTYEELGHMERIPDSEVEPTSGKVFYLPHHAVVTNKLRVVFDGSHKDRCGQSLNEMLHIGPPLQRNLINVCIRFRLHKYVFCADIVKMFRQIWVHEKHRNYQRIVWRETPQYPVAHFRLRTVTYGTSPAPFLAMRVLRQLALDYQYQFPAAAHSILNDFYVDDILTGSDSVSEILRLKKELVDLLACGGLALSKWSSNCWPILSSKECDNISLDLDSAHNWTKVLGLVWSPFRDIFTYKISLAEQSLPTKRSLLSEVSKIFDPMGFLAPATILLKILFQELWIYKLKLGWDDPLPPEITDKWNSYRSQLPLLENLQISRRCTFNSENFSLIGFSDASEKAYSAVIYSRSVSEAGVVEIHLVAAKTRVAPIKQLSIPRLELSGALLLCNLLQVIRSSLNITPANTFAFCDSTIVLAWLSCPPRKWNTFVANRTSQILDILPRSKWNHIRSEENPADVASRGIEPGKLLDFPMWWKGPAWLLLDCCKWPVTRNVEAEDVPEERTNSATVNIVSTQDLHCFATLSANVSSWTKLVRIVAYVLRFPKNCRSSAGTRNKGYLASVELLKSKETVLLWAQHEFATDIEALKTVGHVHHRSKLITLSPFIDQVGLLRVGGRISKAENVPYSIKHPIILPKLHRITHLVLLESHLKFLHAGVSELFTLIRQEFWVIGSRNLIRKVVHDCIKCFRLRQKTSSQLMADLPSSRLSPSFPFAHTGCDYAGPITLRSFRGRKPNLTKGYLALFVCMTTKALHLEAVSDLSTDAFLATLRRFIARRGKCNVIYSDNGTNFKGAARTLSEVYEVVRSTEHNEVVSSTLAAEGIRWEFIPPHSPHFGGIWEAGVKCVKQHLRRVIGSSILTFEELSTLLSQIEALLNSRPLCSISDSDLNPLTPSHFLIGRPYTALAEPSYLDDPPNRLGRWELLQNMVQGFWRRWQSDYLTSLQQRPKWQIPSRDISIGDLVVVKEPNLPPSRWCLGRVEIVHPGQDGHVRVVSIRTSNGVHKRPITKLAVLPCS